MVKRTMKTKPRAVQAARGKGTSPKVAASTPRQRRIKLIKAIERARKSRVLTYVCGDRVGMGPALIGNDAVRPMYDHLLKIGKTSKLDLFLYSIGGGVEVPWRMITMLREHCDSLGVLIPYRAYSAATLIALGCDDIVMSRKAELGPIDPGLTIHHDGSKEEVRVEDVMSFIRFLKEVAALGDQTAIAENVRILVDKLSPWVVGSIYRTHAHIRSVAQKMLASHVKEVDEQVGNLIVETLAERTYSHGHAIGRAEAIDLALPVKEASENVEQLLWHLLESYEEMMELRRPLDSHGLLAENDEASSKVVIAAIESKTVMSAFTGTVRLKRKRRVPNQLNINVNMPIALPPHIKPEEIPEQIQQSMNEIRQQAQRAMLPIIQDQVRQQSPDTGEIEVRLEGAYWKDVTSDESAPG